MKTVTALAFALLAATTSGAHATLAYLPLASVGPSGDPRFDGIEVVELPTMRVVRTIATAPTDVFTAVSPDGATLAVRETAPAPEAIAIYDAQTGALRRRWPVDGCAAAYSDEALWHPLRRELLILHGDCFFNVDTGVIEETPQTLGVNEPFDLRLITTSDRGNYLVVPQATSPGAIGAPFVRVVDLRDPRNGRDLPGLNGWGVIGFGETTLLSQRANGMRYTDLATGADLGPVPMPAGWIPQPVYRALSDGTIIATALGPPGSRQRLVRLRNRTALGEFIAELPPSGGPEIHFEIGRDYALFSNWLHPSCVAPLGCAAGPMTVTSIELASGRSFTRTYPAQALAARGPVLAGGSAPVVPVPGLRGVAIALLVAAMVAVAMALSRVRRTRASKRR